MSTVSAPISSATLAHRIAGLRIAGTRSTYWFSKLFARRNRITIGRSSTRSIRIRDDSVSRLHCVIEKQETGDVVSYRIVDCESYNGVYVRRQGRYSPAEKVDEAELTIFMRIRLGAIRLVPVDANGRALMLVMTDSGLMREAYDVYGSCRGAARSIGMSRGRLYGFIKTLWGR